MKETTPWLELPVLEIPGAGMIGHEIAILNYIGRQCPEMAGASEADFLVSQQLLQEAEDIYQKLGKIKNKLIPESEAESFWTDEEEKTHNKNFGVNVYLRLLENYYVKCGAPEGKFTAFGNTVGECKLFTMLHACKLIKDDVLTKYPGLAAFYTRFGADEKVQAIMTSGGRMGGVFNKYF